MRTAKSLVPNDRMNGHRSQASICDWPKNIAILNRYKTLSNITYVLRAKWFQVYPGRWHLAGSQTYHQVKKAVISSTRADWVNLRYLIPYLRSGICFGILRISEILLHVKNLRYNLHWKMWPGIPNLIMVVGQFRPIRLRERVTCINLLSHITHILSRLPDVTFCFFETIPMLQSYRKGSILLDQ